MKTLFSIAVLGLMTATPALAADPDPNPKPTPSASMTSAPAAVASAKPTRYCVVDSLTGSRIPKKVCNTREQWLKQGFDPLAK